METLGAQLADEVTDLARRSGARSVTLVGHSLGGVIVAASLAGGRLDGVVTRVVTVAAPLRGTRWAHLFPVGAVRDLRAGSPAVPAGIPWLAVASRADVVVDVHSAVAGGRRDRRRRRPRALRSAQGRRRDRPDRLRSRPRPPRTGSSCA